MNGRCRYCDKATKPYMMAEGQKLRVLSADDDQGAREKGGNVTEIKARKTTFAQVRPELKSRHSTLPVSTTTQARR